MTRRDFLYSSSSAASAAFLPTASAYAGAANAKPIDAAAFDATRKFAKLPISNVAYVERGRGVAALFVHGYPLNGFQWRGALERLQAHRRCIAPDVMGLGHTETPEGQPISPATQAEMLAMLLDSLQVDSVDLVANDSGGLVSQVFVAKYPHRVRTLLLTNCDVDQNSPPPLFLPLIDLAKKGTLVDRFIVSQLNDKQLARSAKGLGGSVYLSRSPHRRDDRNLLQTHRRNSAEEGADAGVHGFAGHQSAGRDPRRSAPMEGTRANRVGPQGSDLPSRVSGVARQNAARFARRSKAGRCESVLSRRDARRHRGRGPGAMGYLALEAEAVDISQTILKNTSGSKKLLHLRVQPRSDGGFTLGCCKANRLSHTHFERSRSETTCACPS